jgi:hypothetical protein
MPSAPTFWPLTKETRPRARKVAPSFIVVGIRTEMYYEDTSAKRKIIVDNWGHLEYEKVDTPSQGNMWMSGKGGMATPS